MSFMSTGIQPSEAFEKAISQMRTGSAWTTESGEEHPDDPHAKKPRNTVSVELSPPMLEIWNIFQNAVQHVHHTNTEERPRPGEQDVLMQVAGESS